MPRISYYHGKKGVAKLFKGWNSRKWTTMVVGAGVCVASGLGWVPLDQTWGQIAAGLAGLTIVGETYVDASREKNRTPKELDVAAKLEELKALANSIPGILKS